MRKFLSSVILTALTISASAQESALAEITSNRLLCASNYVAYQAPSQKLTPAPKGYEPFYISTYARHGSRWLINDSQYSGLIEKLSAAKKYGKLTPKGEEVLDILKEFYKTTEKRLGDLTPVGERQHHGIGKRMTQNFPEVFRGNAQVDARSTVVIRCMLSMVAECEELAAFNPNIRIHNDASQKFQRYLNQSITPKVAEAMKGINEIPETYRQKWVDPERFVSQLFNDKKYISDNINSHSLMQNFFDVAGNMQSHDVNYSLLDLFTTDECYNLWRIKNISYYLRYGNSKYNKFEGPYHQYNLLENIIETCDTIVNNRSFNGATMRFGHEVCLMPLVTLLELGDYGKTFDNLDKLDEHWRNYKIYPMASNVQLVFFRPKKGNGDILVKALLNEVEVSLPAKTDTYPYYKWSDLAEYYRNKLKNYSK